MLLELGKGIYIINDEYVKKIISKLNIKFIKLQIN